MINDKSIIRDLLSENERFVNSALKNLYFDLKPIANKVILPNGGGSDDVNEVLQEGILSFYSNLVLTSSIKIKNNSIVNKSNQTVKISSYMYSVFRNIWFSKLRSLKLNTNISHLEIVQDDAIEDILDYENMFEKKKEAYFKSLIQLDEKCKEILNMFWYQRLSFNEIAIKMRHSNSSTSKQIKSRCQKKLKEMCKKELQNA